MARRPERQGTGDGEHVGTANSSSTRWGTAGNNAVRGNNNCDAVTAHDAKSGGDMPRDATSGGSTHHTKHGAAMALSDGNTPCDTSDARTTHNAESRRAGAVDAANGKGGWASAVSPRVLFPSAQL